MYSTISSKIYIVKKIMSGSVFFGGWDQNLQICHSATSATRINQGVEPWVSQRPLARGAENGVVGVSEPGSLAHCVDDNCDVNGNGCSRARHVHQESPASLLNGGDTVCAQWKKQDDRGSQSWVVASGNDRLDDVNGAIQKN